MWRAKSATVAIVVLVLVLADGSQNVFGTRFVMGIPLNLLIWIALTLIVVVVVWVEASVELSNKRKGR